MTPFDLNLRHLRGLLAVRDAGSISAAADAMGLSQPALTQGVVKLESQFGQALFERRPDGMIPTEAGAMVAERVAATMDYLTAGSRLLAGNDFQPDRRITMTQLRAFLSLVDTGGFSSASTRIGLSQTAVHRAVRDLEAAVQKQLVERRGRGVHVNFMGRRFARSCRLAVNELFAAFSELGIDLQRVTIALGATPLARAFLVPEAMTLMMGDAKPSGFQVFEGNWGELLESLRDGVIDLIVGELPPHDSPDLAKRPLYEESVIIVAGSAHPLVKGPVPSLEALASYPWIIDAENSPLRAEWDSLFSGRGKPLCPIECGSIMIIGRLLTSINLLTLATPDQVALQIRSGLLARIPFDLDAHHTIGVTLRDRFRPTPVQARFLKHLTDVSAQIGRTDGRPRPQMAAAWNLTDDASGF